LELKSNDRKAVNCSICCISYFRFSFGLSISVGGAFGPLSSYCVCLQATQVVHNITEEPTQQGSRLGLLFCFFLVNYYFPLCSLLEKAERKAVKFRMKSILETVVFKQSFVHCEIIYISMRVPHCYSTLWLPNKKWTVKDRTPTRHSWQAAYGVLRTCLSMKTR